MFMDSSPPDGQLPRRGLRRRTGFSSLGSRNFSASRDVSARVQRPLRYRANTVSLARPFARLLAPTTCAMRKLELRRIESYPRNSDYLRYAKVGVPRIALDTALRFTNPS